jgi:hypothetical protein
MVRDVPLRTDMAYFLVESVAVSSLAMMGENTTPLINTLLRMALSANTLSSAGLLHSILAYASLLRYGPHHQAMQHQAAALKLVRKASFQQMGQLEACQHVAVAMLLSTYEVCDRYLSLLIV